MYFNGSSSCILIYTTQTDRGAMKVLVTGGAGYIGSHTIIELDKAGHTSIVIDNFSNSSAESIKRVEKIIGKDIKIYEGDVCDKILLDKIFSENKIDAVIHFAGYKFVGESTEEPIKYYKNNLLSTLTLTETIQQYCVPRLVFSSSSTVYGNNQNVPLKESSNTGQGLLNPYAWSKSMNEQILRDISRVSENTSIILLRYFNPVGAHESGLIGEDPKGIPNNLLPYITQVALGLRRKLTIHGNNYDTPDGTCIRDYIHVVDLARGHVAAIERENDETCDIYNLGTGRGCSVLELINAFEQATGKKIPYRIGPRREGDITVSYGDVTKANNKLVWKAERTLLEACADSWRWQKLNPSGYNNTEVR